MAAILLAASAFIAFFGARYAETSAAALLLNVGDVTRIGLPVAAVVGSTCATLTLGATVLAGWLLPPREAGEHSGVWIPHARRRTLALAVGTAVLWTLAAIAQLLLSYSLSSGQAVGSGRFGSDIGVYMITDLGVWMLWGAILAGASSAVALAGDSVKVARAAAAVALLGVMARAMTGHAAGDASHESATSSMFLHLIAVAIWVGPLVLLQVQPRLASGEATAEFRDTVRRFSRLALVAWLLLAFSGAIALYSRVTTIDQILNHPYGQLGAMKIVLLLLLAALGAMQRTVIARTAASSQRAFAQLALLEISLMAAAIGLGAAMSSSPPPAENIPPPPSAAGILTNYPLPPSPLSAAVLGQWRMDVFAVAAAALTLWWAFAPQRTGPRVTGARARALIVAAAAYVLLTSGPIAVYSRVLFSAHLLLSVLAIVAVGVPLACALPAQAVAWAKRLPLWAQAALAASPPVLLATGYLPAGVLRRILESHPANVGFVLACIAAGTGWGLAGRALGRHWIHAVTLVAAAALVAAICLTGATLAPSWFGATGRTWMQNAAADQTRGALAAAAIMCVAAAYFFFSKTRRVV